MHALPFHGMILQAMIFMFYSWLPLFAPTFLSQKQTLKKNTRFLGGFSEFSRWAFFFSPPPAAAHPKVCPTTTAKMPMPATRRGTKRNGSRDVCLNGRLWASSTSWWQRTMLQQRMASPFWQGFTADTWKHKPSLTRTWCVVPSMQAAWAWPQFFVHRRAPQRGSSWTGSWTWPLAEEGNGITRFWHEEKGQPPGQDGTGQVLGDVRVIQKDARKLGQPQERGVALKKHEYVEPKWTKAMKLAFSVGGSQLDRSCFGLPEGDGLKVGFFLDPK